MRGLLGCDVGYQCFWGPHYLHL